MLTRTVENIKSEFKTIKFLEKKQLQQITIAVLIAGLISALCFSGIDILLNFVIQKVLFI
ncbi:MAG: preprotein translocase subunit SecE [Proteobacteria bacterium]|jgi:preprotein translocase subunit SecE|nr:preprotein translocase subunit SecE [Pseudomonadota bacterium]